MSAMTRQRIFYRIGQMFGLVLVISWSWWGLREMNYVSYSRVPLPQFGQVVPHTTKGIVVYITAADASFHKALIYCCVGSGIVVAICLVFSGELSKMLNPPKPPPPPEL
jgi:hypothetical protein